MYSTHSVALAGSGFRGRPVGHDGNRAVGRACDVAGRLTSLATHEVHPGPAPPEFLIAVLTDGPATSRATPATS